MKSANLEYLDNKGALQILDIIFYSIEVFIFLFHGINFVNMFKTKQSLLPKKLVNEFLRCFSTHQLLVHLHQMLKTKFNGIFTNNYNFEAFLTLDKSRKIIRWKENQFVYELIQKTQSQFLEIQSKQKDENRVFHIGFTELQKFISIFIQRKSQFSYFIKFAQNFYQQKNSTFNQHINQNIQLMSNCLQKFQCKLAKIVEIYETKLAVKFSKNITQKLKPISQYDANSGKQNEPALKPQKPNHFNISSQKLISQNGNQNEQNTYNKQNQQNLPQDSKKICKIGEHDSIKRRNLEYYQKQIKQLKNKYYRLNCKTQSDVFKGSNQFPRYKQKSRGKLSVNGSKISHILNSQICTTQGQQDKSNLTEFKKTTNTQHQTAASEMKFSIRLTAEKKNSKLNTSFSIFDKSSQKPSFFKSSNSNCFNPDQDNGSSKNNIEQISEILQRKSSFLKKRSSNKNLFGIDQSYAIKKPNNSVYRQTNFSFQANKRNSDQRRTSTAKVRQNSHSQQKKKSLYFLRASQTQANVQQKHPKELDTLNQINIQNQLQQIKEHNRLKDNQAQNQEFKNDSQSQIDQTMGYRKAKNKKNRRKGFSKKQIQCPDDQSDYIPSIKQIKRNSSVWNQSQKKQRGFNRTSFFRTSGYMPKKNLQKIGKTKFYNLNRKRQESQIKNLNSETNIEFGTKKTITNKFMEKQRIKKQNCIKRSDFAVTAKDCVKLSKQISNKSKNDQALEYDKYIFDIMKLKYDLKFRQRNIDDDFENYQTNLSRPKLRILESEVCYRSGKKQCQSQDLQIIEFSNKVIKKHNQLGQKQLSLQKFNSQYPDLQAFI